MTTLVEDHRREEFRRSAHRPRRHVVLDALLAQAELGDLGVPVGIEQEIFRLEIPVDSVGGVAVLDTKQDCTRIDLASALGKTAGAAEVEEEFATCAILGNVTSKYLKCNTRRRTSAPAPESA